MASERGPRKEDSATRMPLVEALAVRDSPLISLCGAGGKTTLMLSLAREFVRAGERVLLTTTTKLARAEGRAYPSIAAGSVEQLLAAARRRQPGTAAARAGALIAYSGLSDDGEKLVGLAPGMVDAVARCGYFDRILVEADGSARRPLKAPAAHEPVIPGETATLVVVAGVNGLGQPLGEETVFRAELWASRGRVALGSPVDAESLASNLIHAEGPLRGCPAGANCVVFLNRTDTPERRAQAAQVAALVAAEPRIGRLACGSLLPRPTILDVISLRERGAA